MAVSPLIAQNDSASTILTAAKAKSLAVRTSISGAGGKKSGIAKQKGAELAEELNAETRHKYVKGVPNDEICSMFVSYGS